MEGVKEDKAIEMTLGQAEIETENDQVDIVTMEETVIETEQVTDMAIEIEQEIEIENVNVIDTLERTETEKGIEIEIDIEIEIEDHQAGTGIEIDHPGQ